MSKNLNPSLNGTVYHHKNEKIFKKITCNYCIRPIVYISDKNKLNRYFDSMIIKCPYDDCHKEFNRIVCPLCSEVNIIEEGKYFMGHKVKCSGCRNFFGKILCQKCLKVNPLLKYFFKSGEMTCRYASCSEKSFIINYIHSQRINIFNEQNYPLPGQQIEWAYEDCQEKFNEIYCPSCNELNPFPEGDFIFGPSYQCVFSFCNKIFQYLICPNCYNYSKVTARRKKVYLQSNWGCFFCKRTIFDGNSNLKYG